MTDPRPIETWLTDMDGVLVHEEAPIPGAPEFIEALKSSGRRFMVESGLTTALHEIGYVMTDREPDYVVPGETRT